MLQGWSEMSNLSSGLLVFQTYADFRSGGAAGTCAFVPVFVTLYQ
jgi:hypothetical protein